MTNTEQDIRNILEKQFSPLLLEIIDESHLHAGHMGAVPGVSTHFNIKIVSEKEIEVFKLPKIIDNNA